jgi:hypothetical protein
MNPGKVRKIVAVLQADARLLPPELLHVRGRDLRVKVLHEVGPAGVELVARLPDEHVILGRLGHLKHLGLVLDVFPDRG